MSPPRPDWRVRGQANVFSQQGTEDVAAGAALREWLSLADAIASAPADIAVLPFDEEDASLTGMPYTAEAGFLGRAAHEPVFLLPNVKPPHRRGEAARLERLMAAWGITTRTIPVLWEGQGDVLAVGDGRFVCTSGEGSHARTSPEAYEHVAPFLPGPSLHLRFRAEPWFHGNTFLGIYGGRGGRIAIVCEEALLPGEPARLRAFLPDVRFVVIRAEESLRYATNALQVQDRVLAPRGVPAIVRDAWRELGLDVEELDLPVLFGRGGGGAVCMTNRLDLSLEAVPEPSRFQTMRPHLLAALGAPSSGASPARGGPA
jgi:N-dimethylarginine dimethylaminohydrolase